MATGLEALGAASAVLQVISFAGSVISLCYKIYDGQLTPESELEEYASQMIDVTEKMRDRSQRVPSGTPDEKKLLEIVQKCLQASKSLQAETQLMTRRYQKGKFFRAAYTAVRASSHRNKIKDLENSLDRYKEVMETQLLLKICDKNTAIEQQRSQGFQNLEGDVQSLISQIAKGHAKFETLVIREAKATRDEVSTHVTSELQALGASTVSGNQRERLLKSLKVHEMNKRYHDVMDCADATFERVFVSYERVCCKDPEHRAWQKIKNALSIDLGWRVSEKTVDEIDQLWGCFCSWLQSNEKIFWFRGKPGSGKSTLFKFVVTNDNTKRLLHSWSPNTKILWHFLWKIGTEPQNSIKGLLCSLLYGVLYEDNNAIDQVLGRFPFPSSKDSYHDWSVRELEDVLFSVLGTQTHSTCIFIDGLDEISDKDGFLKLMTLVEKLKSRNNLKVCVSSRPETQLANRLESIGAKSLRLEDLTRPEMVLNVHDQLKQFEERGQISVSFLETCTTTLLIKADGVFLWLFLATKSLINGIENGDDERTLLDRLEELPGELEALYENMWARLNANNPVYRKIAARYFRYAIADTIWLTIYNDGHSDATFHLEGLSLATLALLELQIREPFPPRTNDISLSGLKSSCETTANNIHTRCAGMLQIEPDSILEEQARRVSEELLPFTQTVDFIHRTAHDFLTDTEAGRHILNYEDDAFAETDTDIKLFKCLTCLAIVFSRELNLITSIFDILKVYLRLMNTSVDQEATRGFLPLIQSLHEGGVLGDGRPAWRPRPLFLPLLAFESPLFDDFIMSSLEQADLPRVATDVLHEIVAVHDWLRVSDTWEDKPRTALIQKIIMLDANPHAIGMTAIYNHDRIWSSTQKYTHKVSAFEMFLEGAICQLSKNNLGCLQAVTGVIDTMAPTCPDWHRKTIIILRREEIEGREVLLPSGRPFAGSFDSQLQTWGACEVDLQFLLTWFLAAANRRELPTHNFKLNELANSFTKPHVRLRHIVRPRLRYGETDWCYRILAQQPFQGLMNHIFQLIDDDNMTLDEVDAFVNTLDDTRSIDSSVLSVAESLSESYEKVLYEAELGALAEEGLGLSRFSDLSFYPCAVDDSDADCQSGSLVVNFSD